MRLLITVPWWERLGGSEAMLQTILDGVHESGHEVDLVFTREGAWPDELRRARFNVEVIDAGRVRHLHRWLGAVLRVAAIIRERDPDVILNWHAKTQLYGSPAAVIARRADRVVWWQHSFAARTWLELAANLLPARAIGCDATASARAQARMFPRRRTFVVAPGAAPLPPPASVAAVELPPGALVVGLVGRLQPWKGQDRLLRAQALLRERGHRVHLLIVGGDSYGLSPEYARSLPQTAARLGLEHDVTFTGEVPDARPFIAQMDVLVNASDPEPFGIVLLEGMASGVPVVAVDSGGPPDFIEHGKTGQLARSGEPEALADALEPLIESAALREELGRAGYERFMRDYTDVAMRRRFFAALEQVVLNRSEADVPALT